LKAELTNGCEDIDTITVTVTWASAIDETGSEVISVYPNPATDAVYIKTENGIAPEEIIVFNLVGQKVINVKQTEKIDVSALKSGMYSVVVILGNGASVKSNIIVK